MTFSLELEPNGRRLIMKLYRNVENVPELRQKLLKGELDCALIKPSLIVDPFQIAVAANKAAKAQKLTTRTLYTEVLFNLSPSKNITQSLQNFGVGDACSDLIVVRIGEDPKESAVFDLINGEEVAIEELGKLTDWAAVKKMYKLADVEMGECALGSIFSKIAVKDCL